LIPARRQGKIEEYATLAVYLALDESNNIVGQVTRPNGDLVI